MKKTILACLFLWILFCFTGCGKADITSQTKFHMDGSGIRIIGAYIDQDDMKQITSSFEELDIMLQEAAPVGVNLSREMQSSGDAKYEFSFSFSAIEDYNYKVSQIIGKEHNATWYSSDSIFRSNIQFQENNITYDLIKWAFNIFHRDQFLNRINPSSIYEITSNIIYLEDKIVCNDLNKSEFRSEQAVSVKNISVYSSFDLEGNLNKEIILTFYETYFDTLNIEKAKEFLDQFTKKNIIDKEKYRVILYLDSEEEIRFFLKQADPFYKSENLNYHYGTESPLKEQLYFLEKYNLTQFLNEFFIKDEYIYNYISLPEEDYEKASITAGNIELETSLSSIGSEHHTYYYTGRYHYNRDYKANFMFYRAATITDIKVLYELDEQLIGQITTSFKVKKNSCNFAKNELAQFFTPFSVKFFIEEQEDSFFVNLIQTHEREMDWKEENITVEFEATSPLIIWDKYKWLQMQYNITSFFTPLALELESDAISYDIRISDQIRVKEITIGEDIYILGEEENKNRFFLIENEKDSYYNIVKNYNDITSLNMTIQYEKSKIRFIFGSILLGLIVAAGILGYIARRIYKKEI